MNKSIKVKYKFGLTTIIFISLVLGILFGIFFPSIIVNFKFLGDIFLNLIQMNIILLVMGQIIEAIGKLEIHKIGRIGGKTVVIFAVSSLLAAVWGIVFGVILKPGSGVEVISNEAITAGSQQSFQDIITSFFPRNIFAAMTEGSVVQVIVFSIFIGLAISIHNSKKNSNAFIPAIENFNSVIMEAINLIMYFAPIGVFSLISSTIASFGLEIIVPLIKYLVVYGLATLLFLLLWLFVISARVKVSIFLLIKKLTEVSMMAIATVSSAVSLPLAIKTARDKLGVDEKTTSLVVPLGMPLNSNGAAMHMAITVIAVAQMYSISYDFNQLIYIAVLATLSSLANAVVPGASLVSLAIIIPQVGLPTESIAMFAGVDYLVGMLRTILNVDSDIFTSVLVANSENTLDRATLLDGNKI
ncbi:dicarboxylate/amino acid:cation symporter [Facklamia hominis]|uniref:dicarboxylate/amino acid:cation symporter n=1 Tax=Facklamia hominis TaxID=178214 RepID=UPI0029D4110F|nr:dicarboxylate/amino acid:cation symporter [Facklamia hominis]WPJ90642.1 dicarboxylate/amino acid:cation symporter [Facklamia hominis]